MNRFKQFATNVFASSVSALTVVWSLGLTALVPAAAIAQSCPDLSAGDLFKVPDNSAVYLLNANMERLYFPNSEVYHTWYSDFSGVVEIPNTCVDAYPAPSQAPFGVNYRPGSRLVKVQISPSVYGVLPGNTKAKIGSESVAIDLYGADWTSLVRDIPDVFWPNYANTATAMSSSNIHDGMLVSNSGTASSYYADGGELFLVDGTLPSYATGDVREVSMVVFDAIVMGTGSMEAGTLFCSWDPTQLCSTVVVPPPAEQGSLNLVLSANTPAGNFVPINVDNIVFTKVVFTNTSDVDVVVNSVQVGREGLGATGDFTSVTLYDGATKLGSTKTSWTSEGYMNYTLSGGWIIPANSSKELSIHGKLDTAGTYNALTVDDLNIANGTVGGTPVVGNLMNGVNVSVGAVTVTGQGTTSQTKKIGTNDVTLGQFKLAVDSVENSKFVSITLKNKGTAADNDLANLYLYQGTTQLAGPVQMVSDKVSFVLDTPYDILKSKNATFKIMGDVVNGDTHTVEFVLNADTDLFIEGQEYFTNLSVTRTGFDAAADSGTTATTIDGAELNISFTSVPTESADDRTDISLGTLTLSAGTVNIKITEMIMVVNETDGNSDATDNLDIDDFELVDKNDGSVYSATMTDGGDTDADDETWTFSDELYMNAGQTREFDVRGDLPNGIGDGDQYKVTMTVNTTNLTAETDPEGDAVDNFSVGSITGQNLTVKAPYITIRAEAMNAGEAVINDTDVVIFKGTIEAQAGDVTVEQLKFIGANATAANTSTVAANLDKDNWSDLGLYLLENGVYTLQENITQSSMTNGEVDFNTINIPVTQGSSNKITFVVKGTVDGALDGSNTTVHVQLTDATAKDSDQDDAGVKDAAGTNLLLAHNVLETTRTVTLYAKGLLYVSMRNIDSGFNKDRIILAGTGEWVGKVRLKADYEDVKIKDLKLTNTVADAEDSVDTVCLYTEPVATSANLVGCSDMDTADVVFFDDINYVVEDGNGNQDLYIYLMSRFMGNGAGATADTGDQIAFKITTTTDHMDVEGVRSGDAFTFGDLDGTAEAGEIVFDGDLDGSFDEVSGGGDGETGTAKNFIVAGSKVTNVSFVSSYGGEIVDPILTSTGTTTLAIIKVETASHSNKDANGAALKLGIGTFLFDIDKFASTTIAATPNIERIGGTVSAVALDSYTAVDGDTETSGDWSISTATTSAKLGEDAKIDAGDTAYFVVKANISGLNASTGVVDWIRLSLDAYDGASGVNNFDWGDGYDTNYITNVFEYLRLDTTKATGTKIAENL